MEEVETSLQSTKASIRISALDLVSAIARERALPPSPPLTLPIVADELPGRSRGVLILAVRKLLPSCLQGDAQLLEATLCSIETLVDTEGDYQNKLATPTLERLADLLFSLSELPSDKAKNALFNTHLVFARNGECQSRYSDECGCLTKAQSWWQALCSNSRCSRGL